MNGVVDGGSGDLDTNDGKDIVGTADRQAVHQRSRRALLRGLGLAVSGTRGSQTGAGALPTLRTLSLQQQYFAYSGAAADGVRTRYLAAGLLLLQRLRRLVRTRPHEYPNSQRRGPRRDRARRVAGGWLLRAHGRSRDGRGAGVRPRNNFDFGNGHWGAIPGRCAVSHAEGRRSRLHPRFRRGRLESRGRGMDGRPQLVSHAEFPLRLQFRAQRVRQQRGGSAKAGERLRVPHADQFSRGSDHEESTFALFIAFFTLANASAAARSDNSSQRLLRSHARAVSRLQRSLREVLGGEVGRSRKSPSANRTPGRAPRRDRSSTASKPTS